MHNTMVRLVVRFVLQIIAAALLAIPTFMVLIAVLFSVRREFRIVANFIDPLYYALGGQMASVLAWFVLFVCYMLLFNIRRFKHQAELFESVRHIADGHFDADISIRGRNEISELAENINLLVHRLKTSMEEERKAEQTKNELVTNVSHDLRTPLTSIIGYLGLIDQDRYRDEVELRHYIQIAYEKSLRLKVLINDLFEYTSMRHESFNLHRSPLNLSELWEQLLAQYHYDLLEIGMEARIYGQDQALIVSGDGNKLVRVFENLLQNAMRYGRDGRMIEVHLSKQHTEAVIDVVNFGAPIPRTDLPHIFDRFYRVDKSRTEHSGGSGLGLAISKAIVEKHNGSISAVSDSTRTVFTVRLPLM